MALPPLPPSRPQGARARAGVAALADRRRRARRRAQPPRAARVPQHSAEALEIVGNPPDSVDVRLRGSSAVLSRLSRRDRRRARSDTRATGLAPVPHPQRRGPRAVRRRGRAGRAGDARAGAREVRAAQRAGRAGHRRRSRAGLRRRAMSASIRRRWSRRTRDRTCGRSRRRTTEPVSVKDAQERARARRRDHRRGRLGGAARPGRRAPP